MLTKVERHLLESNRIFTLGDCKKGDTGSDSSVDVNANYDVASQSPFFMKLLEDTKIHRKIDKNVNTRAGEERIARRLPQ